MIGGSDCGCQLQSHMAPVAIPTSYTATDPLYLNPHEAGSWTVQLLLLQLQKKNHDSAIRHHKNIIISHLIKVGLL